MSERFTVLLADAIAPEGTLPLRENGHFELVERKGLSGEALAAAIAEADAVIVRSSTTITREALARADRLKVIGRAGVGVDNIDVEAATERGVAVLNAPSGNTISAAELTFALLLSLARKVPAADRSVKEGAWDRKAYTGIELYGKTLGLVGAGRIGGEVAKRARAFGMDVVAYDPYLTLDRAEALDVEAATLEEVLARADVITLHVPLTPATEGLLDDAALARTRPGVYIVNASRGGVVDEAALARALESGHVAGAALDVYAAEPLAPESPLRAFPNIVLTPHLGAATTEAQQNVAVEICEAVRDALLEGDYSRAVNAPAVGGEAMRRIRPLLELAERLGRLAAACADGPTRAVEICHAGGLEEALRPLSAAALVGLLGDVVGRGAVNYVNALHLAASRGLRVERVRLTPDGDYAEYVELRLTGARRTRVAGALLAEGHPRVVRIDDFHVDILPRGALVVLRNRDVPGVIGRVGTLLGDGGVNIAEYHQARLTEGGDALAAVSVDGRLDADLLAALRRVPDVHQVRQVQLD